MGNKEVFQNRGFASLFWVQFLGATNDNFFKNAFIIMITYRSLSLLGFDSPQLVALAGGIFILPFVLFSATAGQIADKFEKSKLVRITKITELMIMCLGVSGFYLNSAGVLLSALFLMGAQSTFFGPLKYGMLPDLVKDNELLCANAYIETGTFMAILIGTILGGLAMSAGAATLWVSIGMISLALLGIIFSKRVTATPVRNPESINIDLTFIRSTKEILKMSYENISMFKMIMGISWFWYVGAALLTLLPTLCKNVFMGNEQVITIMLASFTIGMGLGSFLCNKISHNRVELGVVPVAMLFMGLATVDLYFTSHYYYGKYHSLGTVGLSEILTRVSFIRGLIDLLLISTAGGVFIVPLYTYVQEKSPIEKIARMISAINIWSSLFIVMAAVQLIVLGKLGLNIQENILVLGVSMFISSVYMYYKNSEYPVRLIFSAIAQVVYKVEVEGRENFPEDRPLIIASNHVSYLDWIFIYIISPVPVRFIIDYSVYYNKFLTFWLRQGRLIPIATRKEDPNVLEEAFQNISNELKRGSVLGIFPEGFITTDGEIRRFQPGLSKIQKSDPCTVLPVHLGGLWGSVFSYHGGRMFSKLPKLKRRGVRIRVGKPIHIDHYSIQKVEEIIRSMKDDD